jgi:hypothetical protein
MEKALFAIVDDQQNTEVAPDVHEAQRLVEVGFEFHCDFGVEGRLFRKRK